MAQYLPGIALPKGDRLQRLRCEETSERQAESRWFPVAQVHPQLRGMQIGSIAHNGQARHRGMPPHSDACLWSGPNRKKEWSRWVTQSKDTFRPPTGLINPRT